ncbi:MAG TPA: hypothetical protein VEG60_30165 [Candidatus Binatia bacterium]|nr:hypothetical protein [Candidatus Binatia bacterium]
MRTLEDTGLRKPPQSEALPGIVRLQHEGPTICDSVQWKPAVLATFIAAMIGACTQAQFPVASEAQIASERVDGIDASLSSTLPEPLNAPIINERSESGAPTPLYRPEGGEPFH